MIDYTHASVILSEMVQIGRTFRVAGQRSSQRSLTGTKYGFLQHLSYCDARLTELAHRLLVSAPVASRAIDSLESDGLVERHADPEDGRASLISITDQGRAKLSESEGSAVDRFADALSKWSPEDAEQAISILQELNVHLIDVTEGTDSAGADTGSPPTAIASTTTPANYGSEVSG